MTLATYDGDAGRDEYGHSRGLRDARHAEARILVVARVAAAKARRRGKDIGTAVPGATAGTPGRAASTTAVYDRFNRAMHRQLLSQSIGADDVLVVEGVPAAKKKAA